MSFIQTLVTVIEFVLVVLVLLGAVFNKKLIVWEDKHVPKVRSFFAGLGYAFLIWLEKLFDLAARCVAKIIVKWRKRRECTM